MPFPCPLVRVDSKHYFQYVEDCIPANRAVIQLMRDTNKTPTGVVLVYRLLTDDDESGALKSEILDSQGAATVVPELLVSHARACILPHLVNPGEWLTVNFVGKAFSTVERRWMSSGNYRVVERR